MTEADSMNEPRWLTDAEQRMWRAFLAMRRDLDRAIERQFGETGISAADFALLVPLSEAARHRMRARDLGRQTGWERSRLSHHIRRMEHRGLVTRHGCDVTAQDITARDIDARATYVQLTQAGMTAVRDAAPGHVATVRRCLVDLLSEHEIAVLRAVSERVTASCANDASSDVCDGDRDSRPA